MWERTYVPVRASALLRVSRPLSWRVMFVKGDGRQGLWIVVERLGWMFSFVSPPYVHAHTTYTPEDTFFSVGALFSRGGFE